MTPGAVWLVVGALVAVWLAIVWGPHRIGDYWAESDFYGGYVEGARGILKGALDPSRYAVVGPVYEIALATVYLGVRDWFLAGQLLSVAAATATVLLWFHLLERRGSVLLGLLAALFLAANAYFVRYGYSATTDALAIAIQAGALCLGLTRRSPRAAAVSGLLLGLATLTRYNAAVLLPVVLLAIMADRERPRRGQAALLVLAGFAAPVGAWILFSMARGVTPAFQLHHIVAYEVFARPHGMSWDDYEEKLQPGFRMLWDVIARDPGAVCSRLFFNAGDHLRLDASEVVGWPVALAAVAGILILAVDPRLSGLWPLAVAGALLFLSVVPIAHGGRYSLPLVPIYAALAAVPFATARLAPGRIGGGLRAALAAVVLGVSIGAAVRLQTHDLGQLPTEVLEIAGPLRALAAPGDKIVARKPHIAYYGNVTPVPFPFATDLSALAEAAHRAGARWLFFSVYEARTRPELAFLLDTTGVVPGLVPRAVAHAHPAVLYEIGERFGALPDWFGNDTLRTVHAARARLMIEPNDVLALRTLAAFAVLRGRFTEARELLERAAALDPANGEIRRLVERLEAAPAGETAPTGRPGGSRSGP